MVDIGIVGKPNVGKSTFYNAATRAHAETGAYPFTTIKANEAVGFVRFSCACKELDVIDNPKNSRCIRGNRFAPVKLIDVAGLVPDAHKGRGLGNQFLDDLRQASVLIHVIDASGSTDEEGNPVGLGTRDPGDDIRFLEEEIEKWFYSIFNRNWSKIARKVETEKKDLARYFEEMFIGIGVSEAMVHQAIRESGVPPEAPSKWGDEGLMNFSRSLRRHSKKMIIAANKTDVEIASENIKRMEEEFPDHVIIHTSSMADMVLLDLAEKGAISYLPGDSAFEVIDPAKLSDKEKKGLELIEEKVFKKFGGTGVQECINRAVFDFLGKIPVYPVEDETHFKDKEGRILPDVFLMDEGSTPFDLAKEVHTDIARHYVAALDAKTNRKIGKDHKLQKNDVIKIISKA